MITSDRVLPAMQDINHAFLSAAQLLGVPSALEGFANILVSNLAAAHGETVAVAAGAIAATSVPIARPWAAVGAAADQEPGHA